jgi:hypothetical protein
MERMFMLRCDECGTTSDDTDGVYGQWAKDVRDECKSNGWQLGNVDRCPECRAAKE